MKIKKENLKFTSNDIIFKFLIQQKQISYISFTNSLKNKYGCQLQSI